MKTISKELFELCKQVYEATGWTPTDWQHGDVNGQPIYTSDYLLEKLPTYLRDGHIEMFYEEDEGAPPWCFGYHYSDFNGHSMRVKLSDEPLSFAQGYGYTPLKALLKLTLKLHEERIL